MFLKNKVLSTLSNDDFSIELLYSEENIFRRNKVWIYFELEMKLQQTTNVGFLEKKTRAILKLKYLMSVLGIWLLNSLIYSRYKDFKAFLVID